MKKRIEVLGMIVIMIMAFQWVQAQSDYSNWFKQKSATLENVKSIVGSDVVSIKVYEDNYNHYEILTKKEGEYRSELKLNGGKLIVKSKSTAKQVSKKQKEIIHLYLKKGSLASVDMSGASDIKIQDNIFADDLLIEGSGAASIEINAFYGKALVIDISGATDLKIMDINCATIVSEVSGAASAELIGKTNTHTSEVSGAAELEASRLETNALNVDVSGAADASVKATKIEKTKSGVASIKVIGDEGKEHSSYKQEGDSTIIKVGKANFSLYEGDNDSLEINVAGMKIRIDEENGVTIEKAPKKPKFKPHWNGFELGINNYASLDANSNPVLLADLSPGDSYLELDAGKSMVASINLFEQGVGFTPKKNFGLVTGIGLMWNNYRFSNDTRLVMGENALEGLIEKGVSIRKSKLTVFSVRVPLLLEFQANMNDSRKSNNLFISAGAIVNLKINSHTKRYYNEFNADGTVEQYNDELGRFEEVGTFISPEYPKVKNFDDFYLNPFRADATVRIGWGRINTFATYSLTPLFKNGKGPELYPWTVGLVLSGS